MFVATKMCGDYLDVPYGLRAVDIRRECDKSLARLRTDWIDLYYAHADDRQTPLPEIVEAFDSLISAGKVRFVGASNWATWRLAEAGQIAEANGWASPSALEYRYTYLRPRPGAVFAPQVAVNDQLLDYARDKQLPIVAYSILLNGAYSRSDRPVPGRYVGPDTDARLAALHVVSAETGATPAQVVIAWLRATTAADHPDRWWQHPRTDPGKHRRRRPAAYQRPGESTRSAPATRRRRMTEGGTHHEQ